MQTSQSPAATASQQAREPPRQGQGDRERAAANTIASTDQPGRKLAHLRPFDGTFGIPGAAPPEHAPRRGRRIIMILMIIMIIIIMHVLRLDAQPNSIYFLNGGEIVVDVCFN